MAQTTINVRMDETLKKQFEDFCNKTGLNISVAFNIFAKTVVREQKIPFEISADPFYSESNVKYLEKVIEDIKTGKTKLEEHELIEVE